MACCIYGGMLTVMKLTIMNRFTKLIDSISMMLFLVRYRHNVCTMCLGDIVVININEYYNVLRCKQCYGLDHVFDYDPDCKQITYSQLKPSFLMR